MARSRNPNLPPLPTYVVEGATWRPVLAGGVMPTALVLAAGAGVCGFPSASDVLLVRI